MWPSGVRKDKLTLGVHRADVPGRPCGKLGPWLSCRGMRIGEMRQDLCGGWVGCGRTCHSPVEGTIPVVSQIKGVLAVLLLFFPWEIGWSYWC